MSAFQVLRAVRASGRFVAVHNTPRQAAAYASRPHLCASAVRSYSSKGKEKEQEKGSPSTEEQNGQQQGGKNGMPSSQSAENDIAVKLQAKQDEVVELTSRLRYAQADFMNLQRISAREKEQTKDFAISRFAADLLETADALALALRAAARSESKSQSSPGSPPAYFDPSSPRPDALIQGVEATQRILLQTLAKYGIKPFDPTGDLFDPNHHEALYSAPVPGKKSGEILECQKTGYMIKDRVLRAAQVGVAAEPPVPSSQKSDSEGPQS